MLQEILGSHSSLMFLMASNDFNFLSSQLPAVCPLIPSLLFSSPVASFAALMDLDGCR